MPVMALGLMVLAGTMNVQDDGSPKAELIGDIGALFGPDHYPPAAARAGEQGLVVADLTIDAQGSVTGCAIVEAATPSLNDQTCHLVQSVDGLFRAATDKRGRAVSSHYSLRIRWQLPDSPNVWPVSSAMRSELTAEADGRVSACLAHTMPGNEAMPISCPASIEPLREGIRQHSGMASPPRFRYFVVQDLVFGNDSPLGGDLPQGMTLLQRYRVSFTIDAQGRAVDCQWSVGVGPVDTTHIPTPCQRRESFVVTPDTPRSGYEQTQSAYQILPPAR